MVDIVGVQEVFCCGDGFVLVVGVVDVVVLVGEFIVEIEVSDIGGDVLLEQMVVCFEYMMIKLINSIVFSIQCCVIIGMIINCQVVEIIEF